jgi:hypothetical protein
MGGRASTHQAPAAGLFTSRRWPGQVSTKRPPHLRAQVADSAVEDGPYRERPPVEALEQRELLLLRRARARALQRPAVPPQRRPQLAPAPLHVPGSASRARRSGIKVRAAHELWPRLPATSRAASCVGRASILSQTLAVRPEGAAAARRGLRGAFKPPCQGPAAMAPPLLRPALAENLHDGAAG